MRIGTLFSGIGAPEQALPRVYDEHKIVFACEWDKFARQSYEANYDIDPEHFHKDINDMDGTQYKGKVDMIIGGSPCQDFSIAGLRAGIDGQRGQLIWQYFRIISEVQPEVFIYENVKGMVSDKGGKTLKDFLEVFRSIGYHCHAEVLNTKDYGVPQNRERIYIVGFKNPEHYHRFEYAPKVPLEKSISDILEFNRECEIALIEQRARGYNEGGIHNVSPTLSSNSWHENNILMLEYFYEDSIQVHRRKLTTRECLRLQDFSDSFVQVVSDSQMYKQAGNSMSVNVLEMLMKQIQKAQSDEPTNTLLDFMLKATQQETCSRTQSTTRKKR